MSQPDLGDPRFDEIAQQLRAAAPRVPPELRRDVRGIAQRPESLRRRVQWRNALSARRAFAVTAAGLAATTFAAIAVRGLTDGGSRPQSAYAPPRALERDRAEGQAATLERVPAPKVSAKGGPRVPGTAGAADATALPPGRRFQDYDAYMRLRVEDAVALDAAAKRAMRDTRRLGGIVSGIDYGTTENDEGDARLVLRVPIRQVQAAIARYTELGAIVEQKVNITDLQPQVDRQATSIAQLRRRIAQLVEKARRSGLTVDERIELETARRDLQALTGRRARLLREASYATVTLELTTQTGVQREEPGAFGAFWKDAKTILVTEVVWLLYALVVAGPFALLALLAYLAERARRRRADDALLAHN